MNEEMIEIMSKLQTKAIRYKSQKRLRMSFNDDEYYSYILFDFIRDLQEKNRFLTKRENKLQTIEQMYKSGSVDLDKLRKIVMEEE